MQVLRVKCAVQLVFARTSTSILSCSGVDVLAGLHLSTGKNRLEVSVLQKHIVLPRWHGLRPLFSHLLTRKWSQQLPHYQTDRGRHCSGRDSNPRAGDSTRFLLWRSKGIWISKYPVGLPVHSTMIIHYWRFCSPQNHSEANLFHRKRVLIQSRLSVESLLNVLFSVVDVMGE